MAKDIVYRELDDAALLRELAETKDALFKKRFENATGQLDNVSVLKKLRKDIARFNTELRSREIEAAEALENQRENA
ncbi:MAG: 50S ribosomal protein L29 [Acidimicrobiia bacterium]|nr:50S ribosomal protein L29 [Acidimicrobiia bacterium]